MQPEKTSPAGLVPRLAAAAVDNGALFIAHYLLIGLYGLEGDPGWLSRKMYYVVILPREPLHLFAWVSAFLLYFTLAEAFFRSTPGKSIFGLRVVSDLGGQIQEAALRQVFIRNLARLIDMATLWFFAIGLLYIMMRPERKRIGDKMAGTTVVSSKAYFDKDRG